jgi:hypothetical protein
MVGIDKLFFLEKELKDIPLVKIGLAWSFIIIGVLMTIYAAEMPSDIGVCIGLLLSFLGFLVGIFLFTEGFIGMLSLFLIIVLFITSLVRLITYFLR